MVNDTIRLLGLDGLAVVAVEDAPEGGPVVHLATADECVTTRPRDLPVAGRVCELRWRKRRWRCDTVAGRPHRFYTRTAVLT